MKTKKIELDVDYIGMQGSALTKDEETKISEFIRLSKLKKAKTTSKKKLAI
jgi:hypothetical protein